MRILERAEQNDGRPRSGVHSGPFAYPGERPVVLAWGAGVDSTAAAVEILSGKGRIDLALFADTGGEKPATYDYVEYFKEYLKGHGVPLEILEYKVKNWRANPIHRGLEQGCLSSGTLPTIVFGFAGCSIKYKQSVQHEWLKRWDPAVAAWHRGERVLKIIGYDASPADTRRHAHAGKARDPLYEHAYSLRDLGWDREACVKRIEAAGLKVPTKSACFFCTASKIEEIDAVPKTLLRRIVLMEARAAPRLHTVEGLWRRTVKGTRGGVAKPGSMTGYIREKGLLPEDEVDAMIRLGPPDLVGFLEEEAAKPAQERASIDDWMRTFEGKVGIDLTG